MPSPRRPSLFLSALLASAAVALSQNTQRVQVCRGESVTLEAPPGFETYAWEPVRRLADPNARAITVAPTSDVRYTVTYERAAGANLVLNPGFEDGNTGFSSAYNYVPGGTFAQGSYAILNNPRDFNSGFSNCTDPDGGRSAMFVADGSTVRGTQAWCQRVTVEPGRRYAFSLSVASLVSASPPKLSFSIAGERLGTANLPQSTCAWQRFFTIWTAPAGAAEVDICIVNDNETPGGNDFALDDISLRPLDRDGPLTTAFDITVNEPRRASLDTLLCAGERYRANGLDLVAGQSGTARLRTVGGCDSTLTVTTRAAPPVLTATFDTTKCLGATVAFEGLTLARDTVITRRGQTTRGCDSTHVFTLRFFARTALLPTVSPPSCPGDADASVSLAVVAGVAPYTYRWSDGSTDAELTGVPAGAYGVEVRDADGCLASTEVDIVNPDPIRITSLTPSPAACADEASGSVTHLAEGGTGDLSASVLDAAGRPFDPQRLPSGDYRLVVGDAAGCFAERPFTVTAPPPITLALSGDSSVFLGEIARATLDVGGDGVVVAWDFDARPIDSLVADGQLAFVPTGGGLLRVVGTDANGCVRAASLAIDMRDGRRAYFPTAFSPDGDGVNDAFGPAPSAAIARVLEFQVFDRWGGTIFSTGNCGVRDPTCAWDGRSQSGGAALDPGVFVYRAILELINGVTETDVGEVHLLR